MARDLNRIVESLRNSREVYVTNDGQVEDAREAEDNADREDSGERSPRARTRLKSDVFASGRVELRVYQSVIDRMHTEARRYTIETGGILVGPDPNIITELIPSGPEASRSHASYQFDVSHLQPQLERAESRGLRFIGAWHVHPEGCSELSTTDQQTARRMINDADYGVARVLLPLTTRRHEALETRFFVAEGRDAKIRRVTDVVVCTEAAARPVAAVKDIEASKAAGNLQVDTPPGPLLSRLVEDVQQLKDSNWSVSHRRIEQDQVLRVERGERVFWLLLPAEYPLNAPDILIEHGEDLVLVPYPQLLESQAWSSRRSLSDLLEQAVAWADVSRPPKRITRIKTNNSKRRSVWTVWRKAS